MMIEDSKTLFCSSQFPWTRERISSKFIDNLGMFPQKGRQPWCGATEVKPQNEFLRSAITISVKSDCPLNMYIDLVRSE